MNHQQITTPRWRIRLDKELAYRAEFESLDEQGWEALLRSCSVTSQNHDTVLSLSWPHFCAHATESCGGSEGWCYTFQGNQVSKAHNRHAALVHFLATRQPRLFAAKVRQEVEKAVDRGDIPYPNVRLAGSGETIQSHLPALQKVLEQGIGLWGFTRDLRLAERLRQIGVKIIVSCDRSTPAHFVEMASELALPLAYTSVSVNDHPPEGTLVTFPLHRVGRVREVVDTPTLCPKVLTDFLEDSRPKAYCQRHCHRCHLREEPS